MSQPTTSDYVEVKRFESREITRIPRDLPPKELARRYSDARAGQGYSHPDAIRQIEWAIDEGAPCPFYQVSVWVHGSDGEYLHGRWKMRHRPRDEEGLREAVAALYEAQTGEKPATVAVDVEEMFDPRDWR